MPWDMNLPRRREGLEMMRRRGTSPFNRFFEEFFRGFPEMGLTEMFGEGGSFTPRINVTETEKEVLIAAELPGMGENDIDLSITRDGVMIRGEKREERQHENANQHFMECTYGSFERFIPINCEVQQDKVEAIFDRGILRVTLPKSEEARGATKKVKIRSSERGTVETERSQKN
jgi:HSP20 family protein